MTEARRQALERYNTRVVKGPVPSLEVASSHTPPSTDFTRYLREGRHPR